MNYPLSDSSRKCLTAKRGANLSFGRILHKSVSLFLLLAFSVLTSGCKKTLTATGLSPEENMEKYGIPAMIVQFDYSFPDGMIEDPAEREAMIEAKIAHLQEVNRLFWGDAPGTPEERQEVFDQLWSRIDRRYPAFKGLDLDWDAFHDEYYERIGRVRSYGEFAHIITHMGYVLKDPHAATSPGRLVGKEWRIEDLEQIMNMNVFLNQAPFCNTSALSRIGACTTVTMDEELVILTVLDGSPNPYRLNVGDEIVGFNGVPWAEWVPRLETAGIPMKGMFGGPGATASARQYYLLRSGMANANIFEKINIQRVDTGEIETMDIVYLPIGELEAFPFCLDLMDTEGLVTVQGPQQADAFMDDPMFVYGIILDENIGYMDIRSTNPEDPAEFADQFEEAVLSLMDTDGIIIDLRENGGGKIPNFMTRGLAHLVKGSEESTILADAVRDPDSGDRTRLVDADDPLSYVKSPVDDPDLYYENPIIVLTGPSCVSGGDILVQWWSEFPEFTFIGKDPNGAMTGTRGSGLPYWWQEEKEYVMIGEYWTAVYLVDEEPIDHLTRMTGFVDHEVWFAKEDVINGVDTVREYALQLIREAGSEGE